MAGILVIIRSQCGFESDCPETKFKTITFGSQLEEATVQKSIAELWKVISNQTIKYQLPYMRFDQIIDHKHDIYLYGMLSTKLLAQAANENTKIMFTKTGLLLFFKCGSKSECPEKF